MMQPSHLRDGPRLMVVLEVGGEDTDQVGFVEDNDMVQTFAADGADQAFD